MAQLAIAMLIAYGALTIVVRVGIQLRTTGRTGFVGLRHAGPLGWLSAVLFNGGMALAVISVLSVLHGSLHPIEALDVAGAHATGIVLAALGGLIVFAAQLGMGPSWRIGVSDEEQTDLVTGGWFSICRNPIYAAMILGWIGYWLMVPTWLGIAAVVVVALGLELLVRAVEEPYLLRTHGAGYRVYAARVGRFVPAIGRLDDPAS